MLSGGFRFALPTLRSARTKRKKEAERRQTCLSNLRILRCGAHQRCARLSAFHHGSCCSERTPQLSSRYALPGTWSDARSQSFEQPGSKNRALFSGRYPLLPVPVQRGLSRRPVIMPVGRSFPKPPGSGVYRSARGHRTRSTFRSTLGRRRPSLSEIRM
jgi:hypothetical protein